MSIRTFFRLRREKAMDGKKKNGLIGGRRITALLSRGSVSLKRGAYMSIERQNRLADKYRKLRIKSA